MHNLIEKLTWIGGDMTASLWIESWLEECKQKTTRNRIWLGEALHGRRRTHGVCAPSGTPEAVQGSEPGYPLTSHKIFGKD